LFHICVKSVGFLSIDISLHDFIDIVVEESTKRLNEEYAHELFSSFDADPNVPVESCVNGGILLPNATCSCESYFSGDDCSILHCEHEGLAVESKRCLCPPGWIGRHCEVCFL
jgi:hypothetical protein